MIAMSLCLDRHPHRGQAHLHALRRDRAADPRPAAGDADRVGASIILVARSGRGDSGGVRQGRRVCGPQGREARSSRFCSTRSIRTALQAGICTSSGRPWQAAPPTKSRHGARHGRTRQETAVRSTKRCPCKPEYAGTASHPQTSTPDMKWPAGSTTEAGGRENTVAKGEPFFSSRGGPLD